MSREILLAHNSGVNKCTRRFISMIKFIKSLFGLDKPAQPKESVQEILTPPVVNKVRAISDSSTSAVVAAIQPKPANKHRRPYRGNKAKAKVASTTANKPKQQPKKSK